MRELKESVIELLPVKSCGSRIDSKNHGQLMNGYTFKDSNSVSFLFACLCRDQHLKGLSFQQKKMGITKMFLIVLTLKALITTAAVGIHKYFFIVFQRK